MKPRIFKHPHPLDRTYPWRAQIDGLSWPARTWQEALEKTAVALKIQRIRNERKDEWG